MAIVQKCSLLAPRTHYAIQFAATKSLRCCAPQTHKYNVQERHSTPDHSNTPTVNQTLSQQPKGSHSVSVLLLLRRRTEREYRPHRPQAPLKRHQAEPNHQTIMLFGSTFTRWLRSDQFIFRIPIFYLFCARRFFSLRRSYSLSHSRKFILCPFGTYYYIGASWLIIVSRYIHIHRYPSILAAAASAG